MLFLRFSVANPGKYVTTKSVRGFQVVTIISIVLFLRSVLACGQNFGEAESIASRLPTKSANESVR
jgi:hypothetical protein